MAGSPATHVTRSRRPSGDSGVAVGLRVSHLLGTVDFEPTGLPPAAILIVRRFRDPSPGDFQSDPRALLPGAGWQQAARAGLSDCYRTAAKPVREAVPPGANAVLFADQAELLSCLARDLLQDAASSRWWWRAILRTLPSGPVTALVSALHRDARHVPAALAHLAARGDAHWVLSALAPAQAWSVLESIIQDFDLIWLRGASRTPASVPALEPDVSELTWESEPPPAPTPASAAHQENPPRAIPPPWFPLLSAAQFPADFGIERSALLGVALALHISPATIRSRQFAQAFTLWHRAVRLDAIRSKVPWHRMRRGQPAVQPEPVASARAMEQPLSETDSAAPAKRTNFDAPAYAPVAQPELCDPGSPRPPGFTTQPAESAAAPAITPPRLQACAPGSELAGTAEPGAFNGSTDRSDRYPATAAAETRSALYAPPAGDPAETVPSSKLIPLPAVVATPGDPIETRLGGIFFLVTLLKALRLPGSIEQSCDSDFGIGSWELLELAARCLIGPADAQLAFDPAWKALAALDGRPGDRAAGANFAAQPCYRLPRDWIAALPAGAGRLGIRVRGNRLELWHPPGVLLQDSEFATPANSFRVRRELEGAVVRSVASYASARHFSPWAGCQPLGLTVGPALRRFLAFLMPYLRWRLAASLGLRNPSQPMLATKVLHRPAMVWLTSSHVDVVMNLDQVTGPIRLSGLDADPGWLPEFGRVVKFHYRNTP
jgi:hypothetical protein